MLRTLGIYAGHVWTGWWAESSKSLQSGVFRDAGLTNGENQLIHTSRTKKTNKTNFSETFSFQPTIQFKRVQHKSPKSIQSWFYWFCWFGICEKVGFHYIKPKIQQDNVATHCSCLVEHCFILVCWFYVGKPTFLQCPNQNNQQNQLPSDFESLIRTPAQRYFVSPAFQKTATCD